MTLKIADYSALGNYLVSLYNYKHYIPGKVTNITSYAFYDANNLLEVIIPDGSLSSIGYQAFKDCANLVRLYLPDIGADTKVDIQDDAFDGCTNLRCGCVRVPNAYKSEAISKGKIPANVLNEACESTLCIVAFEKLSCKLCKRIGVSAAIILGSNYIHE